MIVATNIINYNRSDTQLEELILFLVAVAGKNADTTARSLDKFFIDNTFETQSPFAQIRKMDADGELLRRIIISGFGCYTRLEKAFRQLANSNINLTKCSIDVLMEVHGVGRKSASCFLAWTRKDVRVAMLDTHLLKFLTQQKYTLEGADWNMSTEWTGIKTKLTKLNVPKSTPSSKKLYNELEEVYLAICDAIKVNPTEYDLEIWKSYAIK